MQHAGQPHVVDHFERAEDLAGQILARQRLADDLELGRLLQRRRDFDLQAIAQPTVPFHGLVEVATADQLGIAHALGLVRNAVHDAVGHGELTDGDTKSLTRHLDQEPPGFGGGAAEHRPAMRHADRGARAAHVERQCAVAHHHAHALIGDVDLFRHHLRDRGAEPLPAVDLAVIGDDRAVGVDADVGGKLVALERRPRGDAVGGGLGPVRRGGERDDQRAGRAQEGAAVQRRIGHDALPHACCAARRTALRAAPWVPQRQIKSLNASLICASVGFGLRSSSSTAVRIQPLMQ